MRLLLYVTANIFLALLVKGGALPDACFVRSDPSQGLVRSYRLYLISKSNEWFQQTDINSDEMVTKDDFLELEKKIYNDADKFVIKILKERIIELWKTVFLSGQSKISNSEFVKKMTQQYTSNNKDFIEEVREFDLTICKIIDIDSTLSLTAEEFTNGLAASGIDNTSEDWDYFWITCSSDNDINTLNVCKSNEFF
ncbi:uncharacterized protein LOC132737391 [Ruditapes philippinarum]|uniref:uncharacterized protein LOC132737391 n=1 Tax=Ruditapes philippinarum TaxID=129788 RepID=UPI00295AAC6D|nr:uncharacterized protein LOC132737391 [Ruditapes philippinarum]